MVLCLMTAGLLYLADAVRPDKVYAITSASIEEKQNQISRAKEEKENLQNNLSNAQRIKEELEDLKGDLKKYVAALDASLAKVEENIVQLKQNIADKEAEIFETEQELEEALVVEEKQYESMKRRIRFMYESGDLYLLELLLSGGSFADMMNIADYAEMMFDYDQRLYEEYLLNREYIELCKQQLLLEKEFLDEQKLMVEQEQQTLEGLIQNKKQEITRYESDISNKEQAIREYKAEIEEQNEMIAAFEAQIAEEKRRLLESSGSVIHYDGGIFKFPMATYTRMSDDYGMRMHPILGVEQFHNGVDFAAPAGTAIYAAYDGVVVAADYSTTMGNYIMIDHGDSLYTIYMHASALYAKKGDVVVKGETIAAVGSTGRSTGNHLHFTVRLNGSYVSPWNYLSR